MTAVSEPQMAGASPASTRTATATQDAKFLKLEVETNVLRAELGIQKRRIDALLKTKSVPPDRLGPIITGTGIALSSLITVSGFGIVHHFSVRRQKRDEFFKRVQDCLTILERIGRESARVWRGNIGDASAHENLEFLQADFDALAHRLALLGRLQKQFNVDNHFSELKREATLNVENKDRLADAPRADRAVRLAQNLARIILEKYDEIYG